MGLDAPDDAAVYRVAPGLALVQTVDFFTPIVNDARDWGRIAAANALSDVYAMGGRPITALNLVGWPRGLPFELLGRVLGGGLEVCDAAGVAVVGGHSVDDPEPKFGLAVTGVIDPETVVTTRGALPGTQLVLTKPLGMGVISSGIKEGRTSLRTIELATEIMAGTNQAAAEAMVATGVEAATDVTGFGLAGHLLEMLDGAISAEIDFDALPIIPEALALAAKGVIPGGTRRNREAAQDRMDTSALSEEERWMVFDAQTSGGLLIAVWEEKTPSLMLALEAGGVRDAAVVGRVVSGDGRIKVARGTRS